MTKTQAKTQLKTNENKKKLLDLLIKVPVVQIACEKLAIGRASYYRWRKEDEAFALAADEAIQHGKYFINDMAESQLISQIKEKNMTAIIFWLKNNHPSYGNKLELTARFDQQKPELNDQQKEIVENALKLGSLLPNINTDENNE